MFPHFDFYNGFPISYQRLRKEFRHCASVLSLKFIV